MHKQGRTKRIKCSSDGHRLGSSRNFSTIAKALDGKFIKVGNKEQKGDIFSSVPSFDGCTTAYCSVISESTLVSYNKPGTHRRLTGIN